MQNMNDVIIKQMYKKCTKVVQLFVKNGTCIVKFM